MSKRSFWVTLWGLTSFLRSSKRETLSSIFTKNAIKAIALRIIVRIRDQFFPQKLCCSFIVYDKLRNKILNTFLAMPWIQPIQHCYDRPPNPSQRSAFFIFPQYWRDRFLYPTERISTRSNQQSIEHIPADWVPYLIQPYCYGADNRAEVSERFFSCTFSMREKKSDSNLHGSPDNPKR